MLEANSIGIGDTIADPQTYVDIQETIRKAKVCSTTYLNKGQFNIVTWLYIVLLDLNILLHFSYINRSRRTVGVLAEIRLNF